MCFMSESTPNQQQIEEFMRSAVMDLDMFCPYCGEQVYEADYTKCIECEKPNPFRKLGLI